MSKQIFIGIDPDCEKSGVAYYEKGSKILELSNLIFFELYDFLGHLKRESDGCNITVYVECGFLNRSNWHLQPGMTKASCAETGKRVGANHEVAKKIVEMCDYLGLDCVEVKPSKSKVNAATFKKLTGITSRTNQEQRDAAMLVWGR